MNLICRFNWGLTVRNKSERVLKLLEKGPLLKEERDRARKVTRGIEGFGSFNLHRWSSADKSGVKQGSDLFRKCNSHYEAADSKEGDAVDESVKGSSSSSPDEEASSIKVPQDESKPLLAYRKEEPKGEFWNKEHKFSKIEHQSVESALLLGQS